LIFPSQCSNRIQFEKTVYQGYCTSVSRQTCLLALCSRIHVLSDKCFKRPTLHVLDAVASKNLHREFLRKRFLCDSWRQCHSHNRYVCETGGEFVLTFPSPASRDLSGFDDPFYAVWRAGKTDIVVVLTDWRCRIFSYAPIKGQDNYIRSTSPSLVHSWARNSSCTFNGSAVTYFRNEKISNLQNGSIDVLVRPDLYL